MSRPEVRVSICVPTYNGERYLDETLRSASAQRGDDVEVVVCDDGSSDGTVAIVEAHARLDPRVRVVRAARNRGLVGNWNQCVLHARGEWVKLLFQDDVLYPDYLERVRPHLDGDCPLIVNARRVQVEAGVPAEVAAVYRSLVSLADVAPTGGLIAADELAWMAANFQAYNFMGEPSNVAFRRSVALELGSFHPHMKQLVDLEFCARVGSNRGALFLPQELSMFRAHGSSETMRNHGLNTFRAHRMDELMLLHDYCFAPLYRRLRAAAAAGGVALRASLTALMEQTIVPEARGLERSSTDAASLVGSVYRPLADVCARYPALGAMLEAADRELAQRVGRAAPEVLS